MLDIFFNHLIKSKPLLGSNMGLIYYKTIQDCRFYDLQNLGLKICRYIDNFLLELKQFKII